MERETCWTLIRAAAQGDDVARSEFADRYGSAVRRWLGARWQGQSIAIEVDDAAQNIWLECFKKNGELERVEPGRPGGFRAFFYGVLQRETQKVESKWFREKKRRRDGTFYPEEMNNDETSLSKIFDREWARAIMDQTWKLYAAQAREKGDLATQRVTVLRLRHQKNMPPREITSVVDSDATQVSRDLAQAKKDFWRALCEVVGEQESCTGEQLAEKCKQLLGHLGKYD